jgi:hypothetical protein
MIRHGLRLVVTGVVAGVAMAAIPARRAGRVDVARVLGQD